MSNKTYHLKNERKLQKFIEEQKKKKNDIKPDSKSNKNDSLSSRAGK